MSLPSIKLNIEFYNLLFIKEITSLLILSYFSLSILDIVLESLQDTFGKIGTPRYSPIKASTCFLINGTNSTFVAFPIPQFSSR